MAAIVHAARPGAIHPFHAVMLAGTLPLFLGVLLGDYAHGTTQLAEWSQFSARLLAGGLAFGGIALACAIAGLFRAERLQGRFAAYTFLLLAAWGTAFLNALIRTADVASTAPALSLATLALACAAIWTAFRTPQPRPLHHAP